MNRIDDWYVFLVHIVQSLASECMAHVNILIAVMDKLSQIIIHGYNLLVAINFTVCDK